MAARVTNWGLAALVASGVLTLFAGSPGDAWVFAMHDVLGVAIGLLLRGGRAWLGVSVV